MKKKQSEPQQSEQDSIEDCVQKLLQADYQSRRKNKIIMMLEKFDQGAIEKLKKYLVQHSVEAQEAAKNRRICIQRRNFMPTSLRKYSLYQNIQFFVTLHNVFSKVGDQEKKGSSWKGKFIREATKQIQKTFALKFNRQLQIVTIKRNVTINNDLTPQIFEYCIENGLNLRRHHRTRKLQFPTKSDLKAFFNPSKQSIKSQKNSQKAKYKKGERKYIIIQDQQLQRQQIESSAEVNTQDPVENVETSKKAKVKTRSGKNQIIAILKQQQISSQRHAIAKVKIQQSSNNSLDKNRKAELKFGSNKINKIVQQSKDTDFQRKIKDCLLKAEIQKQVDKINQIIQETSLSTKKEHVQGQRNTTTALKLSSHDKQGDKLSQMSEICQQYNIQRIKKILFTNIENVEDDLKRQKAEEIVHRSFSSFDCQKQVQNIDFQMQGQKRDSLKREKKGGVSKIVILSILLDLLQNWSQ